MISSLLFFFFIVVLLIANYVSFSLASASIITLVINGYVAVRYFLKYRKSDVICFEFFFSIAFFLSIYAYFFEITSSGYSESIILKGINNEAYIVKGMVVSTFSYIMMIMGCCIGNKKIIKKNQSYRYTLLYNKRLEVIVFVIYIIIYLLFLVQEAPYYIQNRDADNQFTSASWVPWLVMLQNFFSIIVIVNSNLRDINTFFAFFKKKYIYCILLFFLSLIFLVAGARHMFLTVFLPIVFLYSIYIQKVKTRYVFLGLFIFWFLFVVIRMTRGGETYSSEDVNFVSDFFPASLATSFFIEYTQSHGYTLGSNYLFYVLSIIPFLGGLISQSGVVVAKSSAQFFTESIFGANSPTGLGTSMVGDLYYSFGLVGAVVVFFIIGYLVSWMHKRITNSMASIYIIIIYTIFISECFFMPRGSVVSIIRPISLVCITYFILNTLLKEKK